MEECSGRWEIKKDIGKTRGEEEEESRRMWGRRRRRRRRIGVGGRRGGPELGGKILKTRKKWIKRRDVEIND